MSVVRTVRSRLLLGAAAWLLAAAAFAADALRQGAIEIGHPHARATAVGQSVGSGYLSLRNTGSGADRLVSAKSPIAATVELHSMRMEGDVMRMRQLDAVDLPAGQTVELKPGGLHLMLTGLKGPLKAGAVFDLTLVFEKAGSVTVPVKVEAPGMAGHRH
ncbi:copper chaperone PCu(A)C [Piscinibacter sakaiensis]|uniref:copper chaperone PCu(A)C n=1 Tax=Piscinibacter sakaiensis TaxID=1547922 RepID=UPI003AACFD0D